MTTKPEGIARLGRAVRDRRTELRMTQDDVARAGGPSDVTVRNVESATVSRVNAGTLGKLDHALQWEVGTASSHLQGIAESGVRSAPAPVLLHEASDSALLAEIARRFDLTRSAREDGNRIAHEPVPARRDAVEDPAVSDGATIEPEDTAHRPLPDDIYGLAASRGPRGRDRIDRLAAEAGEESQDPGGEEPA